MGCICSNFLSNLSNFRSFVGAIKAAGGGGDGPEDVMGGLQKTFSRISWSTEEAAKVGGSIIIKLLHYRYVAFSCTPA